MKKSLLSILIFLIVPYFIYAEEDTKAVDFNGSWWAKNEEEGWAFDIQLNQRNSQITGRYCAVAYHGNRIDCDPAKKEKDNITGVIEGNTAIVTFEPYYKVGKNDYVGKAKIIHRGDILEWIVIKVPQDGFYYCPKRTIMKKDEDVVAQSN